jgi:uncharacterized protein YjdB
MFPSPARFPRRGSFDPIVPRSTRLLLALAAALLVLIPACDAATLEPLGETEVPREILLNANALDMMDGDTLRLHATVIGMSGTPIASPSAGQVRGGARVVWSSSNPDVIAIDGTGFVRARKSGTAVLTATSGPVTSKATGRVGGPKRQNPGTVIVSPDQQTLASLGLTVQLEATVLDDQGNPIAKPSITWSSQNPQVATVDGSGTVTSRAVGLALITAISGDVAETATLHVLQEVAAVTVSPSAATVTVGDSVRLTATATDAHGVTVPGVIWTWSSSDTVILRVGPSGTVSAMGPGSATIRATADGQRGSAVVLAVEESPPPSAPAPPSGTGVWISAAELAALPISGTAWDALLRDAARDPGLADISDQNSSHDTYTLAAALVCVRTGQHCDKARAGVVDAIGTEQNARWLAVGRNLLSYVIAADLLELRADGNPSSEGSRVQAWIGSFLTRNLAHNITGQPHPFVPFESGSNASAQEGAAYAAVAVYLGDVYAIERVWDAFRTFVCDPDAPDREKIDLTRAVRHGWAHDDQKPCAVNPLASTKRVPSGLPGEGTLRRLDGSIGNDMRRGGDFQWTPGYTSYPWVGLEGLVPAGLILHRAGYPAFEVADRAVLRTHEYLWHLRQSTGNADWFDDRRAAEVKHLVNVVYGRQFPVRSGVGAGRIVGYTDWTHPAR